MKKIDVKNIVVGFGKGGKTLAKFLAGKGELDTEDFLLCQLSDIGLSPNRQDAFGLCLGLGHDLAQR